jgi:type IV fimbrial biogenesis protein FimT
MKTVSADFPKGFTLIELMVTIAIAGVLVGVAIPSFTSVISSSRLNTSTNELITALNLARSEAVKRSQSVTVRQVDANSFTHSGDTANWAGANWEDGWDVFTDVNNDGNYGTGDVLIRSYPALPANFTLRGNNNFTNFIRFTSIGFISNSVGGAFAICESGNISKAKLIIVKGSGRARIAPDTDHDGIPEKEDNTEISSCTSGF